VTKDIVSRTDCAGPPAAVWQALLDTGHLDQDARTLTLRNAVVKVRSQAPGLGLRGRARWAEVTYRITAFLLPHRGGTRLVLTGVVAHAPAGTTALRMRQSRRLAARDLRELGQAVGESSRAEAGRPTWV
jgi:hypothetical protein